MEELIGRFRSPFSSVSDPLTYHGSNLATPTSSAPSSPAMDHETSNLEALPAEIITHVLAFLPAVSLAALSRTSHLLRSHAHNDLLWMQFVRENIPNSDQVTSHSPAKSWRDLYVTHHPYWFLVRHKLWFGDLPNTGTIIIIRYNPNEGCIEGFRLIAEHGAHTFDLWQHNPDVIIHTFNPKVHLWLEDPVIKLAYTEKIPCNRLQKEVPMFTGSALGICSMISLCQPIAKQLQDPSMALWPPSIIPSVQRVRNESPTKFRDEAHRPGRLDSMSDRTFRVRKWMQFTNMMQQLGATRTGEDVVTYSTLLSESYAPTKDKPWQGVWVGDYSGHGCEFLLVMQREVVSNTTMSRQSSTGSLPPGMSIEEMEAEAQDDRESGFVQVSEEAMQDNPSASLASLQSHNNAGEVDMENLTEIDGDPEMPTDMLDVSTVQPASNMQDQPHIAMEGWRYGRLEAIKLTGDINVPRGQYTWIAEDIGPKGLLRVGNEQMFTGARMVKSWGRIAGRGFRHDRFIASQLIMISHDTLAQYWEVRHECHASPCTSTDNVHRTLAISPSTNGSTSKIISPFERYPCVNAIALRCVADLSHAITMKKEYYMSTERPTFRLLTSRSTRDLYLVSMRMHYTRYS